MANGVIFVCSLILKQTTDNEKIYITIPFRFCYYFAFRIHSFKIPWRFYSTFFFLIFGVGLIGSCLDAALVSERMKKVKARNLRDRLRKRKK
jgi:hypothetical protein